MREPVALHRVVEGPDGGPVLVLVHAIGTSLAMWDPQVARLTNSFRVIRYDQRGHGDSAVPRGPYAIQDLAEDLLRLTDELGVDHFSICGLSLGAMVGLWIAAHAPDRVDRLVGCSVVARPPSPEAWLDRAATVRRGGTAAVERLVLERWGYAAHRPEIASLVRAMLLATPAEGYAACCDAIARLDLEPDLGSIAAPTLLIAGSIDPSAPPPEAEKIASAIPDGRVAVIDGAAHLLNVEQPEAVTNLILEHLLTDAPTPWPRTAVWAPPDAGPAETTAAGLDATGKQAR